MKDRIEATLAAIAECEEAMMRAKILLQNLQYPEEKPAIVVVQPDDLKDDPPSRAA